MLEDNLVIFKGNKDGIAVMLDDTADFDTLKGALRKKVAAAKNFFGGAKTNISFQGRVITTEEEAELLRIISRQANLEIAFVTGTKHAELASTAITPAMTFISNIDPDSGTDEGMTMFFSGTVRSGQSLRYDGSIVILGDVNSGAEVIATGNIIVLGAARGMLHAGCLGDMRAYTAAMCLAPVQLRIGDIITYISKDMTRKGKKRPGPSYAYVNDGQIYLSPM
ncbi:MAG: septum site-determining protein MinC [Clostridiales bacterium]|jgi:septum site-determining protein MinC|nr:septum site-determining protein MinC [Clostridiales bacterium]